MNHKEEALKALTRVEPLLGQNVGFDLEYAQVHATLYLAEQQRISNLIAIKKHEVPSGYAIETDGGIKIQSKKLNPVIAEALGIKEEV